MTPTDRIARLEKALEEISSLKIRTGGGPLVDKAVESGNMRTIARKALHDNGKDA